MQGGRFHGLVARAGWQEHTWVQSKCQNGIKETYTRSSLVSRGAVHDREHFNHVEQFSQAI